MKTFQEFINEKWVADIVKRGTNFPIYENPTSKDLVDLKKSGLINDHVRFIAYLAKKKLYVWSGMDVIHDTVIAKLAQQKIIPRIQHDNLEQALCGECKLIDGRLSFAQNDGMDSYFGPIIYRYKNKANNNIDSFLPQPYYELKDLLNDLPDIIDKYKWIEKYIDEYQTKSSPALVLQYTKRK